VLHLLLKWGITIDEVIVMTKTANVITLPRYNDETLAAMKEARDIASGKIQVKSYASIKEMVAELESESEL